VAVFITTASGLAVIKADDRERLLDDEPRVVHTAIAEQDKDAFPFAPGDLSISSRKSQFAA